MSYRGLAKVISGGQTGADQGGLIAAHQLGILTGGTAPENWGTSAGRNPLLQVLGLTQSGTLKTRTVDNVKDSDGTVIFTEKFSSPGSVMTRSLCEQYKKPYLDIDLVPFVLLHSTGALGAFEINTFNQACETLHQWIMQHQIRTLNVAGNRERHSELLITEYTKIIVLGGLELLDLDKLLIRDSW